MTEIHPAAEIFPLMGEDELAALAEDIKTHGLRQPCVLDKEGRLLDGRNRLAACKLAKVKPEFVTVNGADPVALVVSLNVKRRNLTPGQRAIAAAEAWDQVSPPGRGKQGRADALAAMFDVGHASVQRARALVERAPAVANEVKYARADLTKTYEALRAAEEQAEYAKTGLSREIERLQKEYDELLQQSPAEEVELVPLRPDEVEIRGADITMLALTDEPRPKLDKRPEVKAHRKLVGSMSSLATALGDAQPALPRDRFLDLSVLSARDATQRLIQNATRWLRAVNDQYAANLEEGEDDGNA